MASHLVDMGRLRSTSVTYRMLRRLELFLYRHADQIVVLAEGSPTQSVPTAPIHHRSRSSRTDPTPPCSESSQTAQRCGTDTA